MTEQSNNQEISSENLIPDYMKLDKKRRDFLLSIGFEQTYECDKPTIFKGAKFVMEKWERQ